MKKIMVVDDEPDFLVTIKELFNFISDEYELITADSGMQCLEHLKNNNIPDLILLDILMPEMNGLEVARKMHEKLEWRNIPIIFVSAVGDKASKKTAIELSEKYIEKPFDIENLKKIIDAVLKK